MQIRTMISQEEVEARIRVLADQINQDYAGKTVHLVGILRGGAYFLTELAKYLTVDVTIDFMAVSSYGSGTVSSGEVKIKKDTDDPIEGKEVIIVEDIIDTGYTMSLLLEMLPVRKPASLKLAALLNKPDRRVREVKIDYLGFEIPDLFVIGCGMDYDQKYRNLPYIGVVEGLE